VLNISAIQKKTWITLWQTIGYCIVLLLVCKTEFYASSHQSETHKKRIQAERIQSNKCLTQIHALFFFENTETEGLKTDISHLNIYFFLIQQLANTRIIKFETPRSILNLYTNLPPPKDYCFFLPKSGN
jgi:hypothetical protein